MYGGLPVSNFGTADHPVLGNAIAIKDWTGTVEQLRVLRVGGMDEYEEMLAGGGGGFFGNMFDGLFKEVREEQAESDGEVVSIEDEYNPDKDPDCIHIFSLASGHAYERFQKIMFQSLLEHTNSKVKFWLLDNFASPQFKDFVPVMAKEYGFYYEFVSYNWPHWLRRQTQKQRVMWGYKILFLDVLFPLDVKRVIFVDADQILRADVKELWEMDLGEAPYGYTPMCMSNKEMEGFMFWNQGFWCACTLAISKLNVRLSFRGLCQGGASARETVPHLRALRRRPAALPRDARGRPAARHLRPALAGPQLARQPRPGFAQLCAALDPDLLAAAGVAVVRDVVLDGDQEGREDDRHVQQPADQDAEGAAACCPGFRPRVALTS